MTYDKDYATDLFRARVLEAMDQAAFEIFHVDAGGPTDAHLPELFKALDLQLEKLCQRHNHPLYEGLIGTPKWIAERNELKAIGVNVYDEMAYHE